MIEVLPWVERLGGWVVVVVIVFSGIRRLDMMAKERNEHFHRLVESMQKSLELHADAQRSFELFEKEENQIHQSIISSLEKQTALLDAILARLASIEDRRFGGNSTQGRV